MNNVIIDQRNTIGNNQMIFYYLGGFAVETDTVDQWRSKGMLNFRPVWKQHIQL